MKKHINKLTAAVFMSALMLSGCGAGADNSSTNDSVSEPEVSVALSEDISESSDVSEENSNEEISYPPITTTKEETETQLRMGGWQYLDGTAQGENPEDVVPNADKNAWYYGSALWFKEGGTAILTVNGSDENASYTVNEDSTITVTADSIGGDGRFALGKDEKYGTILYSKTDDNIRFFMAMI